MGGYLPYGVDHTTGASLFGRHGRQQQQQPQQQQPEMIDNASSRKTSSNVMRSAVLRASHQRTKPVVDKRKKRPS